MQYSHLRKRLNSFGVSRSILQVVVIESVRKYSSKLALVIKVTSKLLRRTQSQLGALWEQRERRKALCVTQEPLISRFEKLNSGRRYIMPLAIQRTYIRSLLYPQGLLNSERLDLFEGVIL